MAFSIIELPDEPIVIVTLDLPLDQHMESLHSLHVQLNHLVAEADGDLLYVVIDVSDQEVGFSDILIGLDVLENDPASWINYSYVQTVVAGSHPMVTIAKKRVFQHLRIQIAVYPTLDDALNHIRDD